MTNESDNKDVSVMPTGVPTGRLAMWWFLSGEVVIFGGLIASFVLYRLHHPEWAIDASHTQWIIGAINTFLLLSSSLTIVQAYQAIDEGQTTRCLKKIGWTVGLGILFLLIKSCEYTHEIRAGYTITKNLFWSFYYLMTGLHAVHILGGLVAMVWVGLGVKRGHNLQRVEYVGLYWHLVDIVWIFLFPLLYITS